MAHKSAKRWLSRERREDTGTCIISSCLPRIQSPFIAGFSTVLEACPKAAAALCFRKRVSTGLNAFANRCKSGRPTVRAKLLTTARIEREHAKSWLTLASFTPLRLYPIYARSSQRLDIATLVDVRNIRNFNLLHLSIVRTRWLVAISRCQMFIIQLAAGSSVEGY